MPDTLFAQDALAGGFSDPSEQSAHAFRAALSVLARPGTIETLSGGSAPVPVGGAAATLLLTLCDHETPLFLAGDHDTQPVRDWIGFHIGAPIVGPSGAMFALGTWDALMPVSRFALGTSEYPDRSATLIVECETLSQQGSHLTGPGIKDSAALSLPEIETFVRNAGHYPLGLDFYFTADTRVAGLPRTTRVRAAADQGAL